MRIILDGIYVTILEPIYKQFALKKIFSNMFCLKLCLRSSVVLFSLTLRIHLKNTSAPGQAPENRVATMRGNQDNEVNSYFWLSAPNGNEQKERSPRVWEEGRNPYFFNVTKNVEERSDWQSLMDSKEVFVVLLNKGIFILIHVSIWVLMSVSISDGLVLSTVIQLLFILGDSILWLDT